MRFRSEVVNYAVDVVTGVVMIVGLLATAYLVASLLGVFDALR